MENITKAKMIKEQLDGIDAPKHVKQGAILGVMMGAKAESVIKGLAAGINEAETTKAESIMPKPSIQADYTEIERVIAEMMLENTGVNIMDSGGAHGRAWQENREIEDFRKLEPLKTTIYKDGEVELSLNLFHFLTSFLSKDDLAKEMEKELEVFGGLEENKDLGYFELIREFAEKLKEERGYTWSSFNSYNSENILSQVIQGVFITTDEKASDEYPNYLILQIHGGCDVRGGYTAPRVFKLNDFEYFSIAMTDIDAFCDCTNFVSDDCGYHWYGDEDLGAKRENGLPKCWIAKPKKRGAKDWEYKLMCERCKKQVRFNARLDV